MYVHVYIYGMILVSLREAEPLRCVCIHNYKENYYKESAHMIVGAEKSQYLEGE